MSEPTSIHLRGVRVHNLKGVDLDLPLHRLTVFTGVSGAGKSSLAFDTLYAESQRRYLQSFSAYTRQFLERLDKPDADFIGQLPPAIAVAQRESARGQRATVGSLTDMVDYLRLLLARAGELICLKCGLPVLASSPADVVAAVAGLPIGTRFSVAFPSRPSGDGDIAAWAAGLREEGFVRLQVDGKVLRLDDDLLPTLGGQPQVFVLVDRLEAGRVPPQRLTDSIETAFAGGMGRLALLLDQGELPFDQRLLCPRCDILYPPPDPRLLSYNDPSGACPVCAGAGVLKRGRGAEEICAACHGARVNDNARTMRLGSKDIAELASLSVAELANFLDELPLLAPGAPQVLLDQMRARLGYLLEVELGYLTLERRADSLSAGEGQRVRLTASLSAQLVNALYILDEPTVGLHARDTQKLLGVLLRLRDAGNTVVLVEHDADVIQAADYVVDLGPGAGEEGGSVVFQGSPGNLRNCEDSLTAAYLSGRRKIAVPALRRPLNHGNLRLVGARAHNLLDLTVDFPLGVLCVVTGVSGAGKSSLVEDELYPALCRRKEIRPTDKTGSKETQADVLGVGQINDVVLMDQTPLTRTARSNAATYVKVFDEIRQLFAETTEARIHNYGAAAFSFNQPGGRCDTCEGQGTLTVDMQFLADVTVTCPECHGRRYQRGILNVKVRSLDIAEVLDLTVREAFRFFRAQQGIERRLKLLLDVGLDYLRLGQPADTLSGGECQRLKLAGHLAANRKPRCLFLLDEPTAGLHPADVSRLLDCFSRLLQTGHSLIVVEHDLDVIKCADHVIDLGPGAGPAGGRVVAAGTPEQIVEVAGSFTGQALRDSGLGEELDYRLRLGIRTN